MAVSNEQNGRPQDVGYECRGDGVGNMTITVSVTEVQSDVLDAVSIPQRRNESTVAQPVIRTLSKGLSRSSLSMSNWQTRYGKI